MFKSVLVVLVLRVARARDRTPDLARAVVVAGMTSGYLPVLCGAVQMGWNMQRSATGIKKKG